MNRVAAYETLGTDGRSELVNAYGALVKRIAHHLMGRLPETVQIEDLIQAGMIGLLEASRSYDASQGASFETFAGIRIRGAMLDEVRRNDWAPRSVHRRAREVSEAIQAIEHREGRSARPDEIAAALSIDINEYHQLIQDSTSHRLISMEDAGPEEETLRDRLSDPDSEVTTVLQGEDARHNLVTAISELPEREQLVMSLYYDQELNLKEIGAVLGVSESRVCQIHGQALMRIKARMGV